MEAIQLTFEEFNARFSVDSQILKHDKQKPETHGQVERENLWFQTKQKLRVSLWLYVANLWARNLLRHTKRSLVPWPPFACLGITKNAQGQIKDWG